MTTLIASTPASNIVRSKSLLWGNSTCLCILHHCQLVSACVYRSRLIFFQGTVLESRCVPDLLSAPRAPDGIQAPVVISPLCLLLQPACLLLLLQWLVSETSGGLHAAHTTCQTPCRQWHYSRLSSSPHKNTTTQKSPEELDKLRFWKQLLAKNAERFKGST